MLVISKYGLDRKRLNKFDIVNDKICHWLKVDFYNKAFNDKEKKYIKYLKYDNVFLLTSEEAKKYFARDDERKCKATEYAVKNGACKNNGGYTNWLLHSNIMFISVYYIDYDGKISFSHVNYDNNYAVRPALWIKI